MGTEESAMRCRGIRGAITVEANSATEIIQATRELLEQMLQANDVAIDDIASIIFTTTIDLNAEFPAAAVRELGWRNVPLLDGHEMDVPNSLPQCLRILMHVNTKKRADEIIHVYLKGAKHLRELGARGVPQEVE